MPRICLAAITLASLTWLRLGYLVRLEWANVGDTAIIVDKSRERSGRTVIPIHAELRQWLDARPSGKGFDRRIHHLRGTFVTFLAMKGLTDEEITRIFGWTAKGMAEIRARYVDEARTIISLASRLSA